MRYTDSEKSSGVQTAPAMETSRPAVDTGTASFAGAVAGREKRPYGIRGGSLPQAIAHRGYKAEFPENTMEAFKAAVVVGSHAIETDLHLTRDKVVVLSHDATLTRCFGRKERIADCDWDFLATLRTLRKPSSQMPRLIDLLEYLALPGMEDIWILLDVKRHDDARELVSLTAQTIASVPTSRPWKERIVFGCWDAKYMRICQDQLAGFPIAYIGWSIPYAQQLLKYDGIHFNLVHRILVGPWGTHFVARAHAKERKVFVWTVNDEQWMDWSIEKGVDGVITDDPKLFLDVCRRWEDAYDTWPSPRARWKKSPRKEVGFSRWLGMYTEVVIVQMVAMLVLTLIRIPMGSESRRVQRALNR